MTSAGVAAGAYSMKWTPASRPGSPCSAMVATSDLMPEVATIAEQGLPGLDAGVHFMLYAPAATPADVISLLNGELNKIVGDSALKARFASIGYDPTALTPDAAAAIMRKTGEAWAPLIKRLNIKLD